METPAPSTPSSRDGTSRATAPVAIKALLRRLPLASAPPIDGDEDGGGVVGVATTHPVEALKDCDLAVTSLLEVTPLILGKLLTAP
jgi:hypothetical protein